MKQKIYEYCKITMSFIFISTLINGYLYSFPKGSLGYELWNKTLDFSNVETIDINTLTK